MVVGSSGQGGEDDQDDGRHQEGVGSRPVVGQVAESQLANDSSDEGDVADIFLGGGTGIDSAVLQGQDGRDGSDNLNTQVVKNCQGLGVLGALLWRN